MPLDPDAKRLLRMLAAGASTTQAPRDAAAIRASFERVSDMLDDRGAAVGSIEQVTIPGPGGPLAVRRYRPPIAQAAPAPCPALIYFHGGAWVFCGLNTHDGLCRALCRQSGADVFAVAYRQGPEHKFPAPMEDAAASLDWIIANTQSLGVDRARIAVGGDSAGATLAIGACLAARDAGKPLPALQLLICPKTDVVARTKSRSEFAAGYFLEEETITWALAQLCPSGTDLSDWRLSPLQAPSLAGLPPALIHTAEFDPLRDEGEAFAARLKAAGVPVHLKRHDGLIHHFYGLTGAIPRARQAVTDIGDLLAARLR